MPRTGKWIALIATGLLLSAASFGQTPSHRADLRRQPVAKRGVALPVLPSGPLPQVPMDQLPSAPPQVSYQGGLLTIVAQNASLGDILREVHKRTGASIEVPPSATERVATRLGPGPARDVLANLLNGSAFNYVMVGSASDPNTLASVMLTPKPGGGETAANAYQPPPQYAPPERVQMAPGTGPGGPVVQPPANDEDADAEDQDDNADQDQAQGQADGSGATAQDGSQPNAGPKSPQEILEMLRQRQQGLPGQQIPRPNPQPPDNQ